MENNVHGIDDKEQRYATKDGITVLIQKIPANSYLGRRKHPWIEDARYRLTYNRDVPDADSLVPQAKFFSTYEAIFDWLDNPRLKSNPLMPKNMGLNMISKIQFIGDPDNENEALSYVIGADKMTPTNGPKKNGKLLILGNMMNRNI